MYKNTPSNPFLYLGSKHIYCIFSYILHNLFSFLQNAVYFTILPVLFKYYFFFPKLGIKM